MAESSRVCLGEASLADQVRFAARIRAEHSGTVTLCGVMSVSTLSPVRDEVRSELCLKTAGFKLARAEAVPTSHDHSAPVHSSLVKDGERDASF